MAGIAGRTSPSLLVYTCVALLSVAIHGLFSGVGLFSLLIEFISGGRLRLGWAEGFRMRSSD